MSVEDVLTDGLTGSEKADLRDNIAAAADWKVSEKTGRQYVANPSGNGAIYRHGDESVQDAIERTQAGGGKKRRRKPDTKPDPGKKARSGPPTPSDTDLENMLAELLALPAMPAAIILHCQFCATHFATQAAPTAHQLVMLAKDSPPLRAAIVNLYRAWTNLTYGGILLAYVGKPMLHHLAPPEVLATAGPILGVPPRPDAAEKARWGFPPAPAHAHTHTPPREAPHAADPATPPADPFAA